MRRPRRSTVIALLAYWLLAIVLTKAMWADPSGRSLAGNPNDEVLFEWFLARTAHAVTHLDLSLITHLMNVPKGVNLMANTSIIVPGLIVTPVTLVFGASASFVLLLTLGPALTAWTSYLALRRLVHNPGAAVVGGLVFGFCPAMVAQSLSHLHMTLAFLIPLILMQVYDLVATTKPPATIAVRLAVLTVLQIFIGEEWLFIAALLSIAALVWLAVCRPNRVLPVSIRLVQGGGLALVLVLVVAGYPLWVQFYGAQSVTGSPFLFGFFSTDLQGYFLPSSLQRFGSEADKAASLSLRGGITEQNANLGWPFLLVVSTAAVLLRRSLLARAAVGAAITMVVLSLGPALVVANKEYGLLLPWHYVARLPVFEAALPIRFPFAVWLMAAVLVALAVDRVTRARPAVSVAPLTVILLSLLLLVPRPFETVDVTPVPRYFTTDVQRDVPDGATVLVVPVATPQNVEAMRWQVAAGMRFAMPGGFHIAPAGEDRRAFFSPDGRPTQDTLTKIHKGEPYAGLDDGVRAAAQADLAYWGATHILLGPSPRQAELRAFLTGVTGAEPRDSGGVFVWDLRD